MTVIQREMDNFQDDTGKNIFHPLHLQFIQRQESNKKTKVVST